MGVGGRGGGGVKNLLAVIGFKQVGHQSGFEYSGWLHVSPNLQPQTVGVGGRGGGVKNLLAVIGFKQVGHQSGFEYSGWLQVSPVIGFKQVGHQSGFEYSGWLQVSPNLQPLRIPPWRSLRWRLKSRHTDWGRRREGQGGHGYQADLAVLCKVHADRLSTSIITRYSNRKNTQKQQNTQGYYPRTA